MSNDLLSDEKFSFRSNTGTVTFHVPVSTLQLSKMLYSIYTNSAGIDKLSIVLPEISHPNEKTGLSHLINTDLTLKYVHRYLMLWHTKEEAACYVKENPVSTGDPSQILQAEDLQYIETYIKESITECQNNLRPGYTDVDWQKYKTDKRYTRSINIRLLGELLSQVDEQLDIESLSNKIYTYIACEIYKGSILDYDLAMQDPTYQVYVQAAESTPKLISMRPRPDEEGIVPIETSDTTRSFLIDSDEEESNDEAEDSDEAEEESNDEADD